MVLHFTSGNISPCYICLLKTIWVFHRGHFMSRAAMRGTVWRTDSIMRWGGLAGRCVCQALSVRCLRLIDVETPGLASGLQPVSNVRKAHCAAGKTLSCTQLCLQPRARDCRHASEDPSTAPCSIKHRVESDGDKAASSHFPLHVLCEAASQLATPPLPRRDNNRSPCIP